MLRPGNYAGAFAVCIVSSFPLYCLPLGVCLADPITSGRGQKTGTQGRGNALLQVPDFLWNGPKVQVVYRSFRQ